MFVVATTNIPKGNELLISYGEDYWEGLSCTQKDEDEINETLQGIKKRTQHVLDILQAGKIHSQGPLTSRGTIEGGSKVHTFKGQTLTAPPTRSSRAVGCNTVETTKHNDDSDRLEKSMQKKIDRMSVISCGLGSLRSKKRTRSSMQTRRF